ncbi:MAG: hypothetical protein QOI31_1743 [Solirubrobacterales bacterium]|nr:hypothetical protein [Solirubrobacterales bacterium]
MNKHRLLWPPWPDELVDAQERPLGRRRVGRDGEQLALPITVDGDGVLEKLDADDAPISGASEKRHPRAAGTPRRNFDSR